MRDTWFLEVSTKDLVNQLDCKIALVVEYNWARDLLSLKVISAVRVFNRNESHRARQRSDWSIDLQRLQTRHRTD
jgi:hypothetical protein